jgi:anti-sigma-K factor RskA
MSALYMFPPNEPPVEDRDLLAAEYALGVLDPGEAAAIRLRAETDRRLRADIAAWQSRLAFMTAMLPQTDVPEGLWLRLEAEIGPAAMAVPDLPLPKPPPPTPAPAIAPAVTAAAPPMPPQPAVLYEPLPMPLVQTIVAAPIAAPPAPPAPVQPAERGIFAALAERPPAEPARLAPPPPGLAGRIGRWQLATAISLGLAASLGVLLVIPRGEAVRAIAAIGPVSAPAPLFLAECNAAGRLTITPLATIAVPSGRDLEVWILPPSSPADAKPNSLGVLPANGKTLSLGAAPAEGTQLLVTMEPRGGSPTGQITGPVLYGGVLANH